MKTTVAIAFLFAAASLLADDPKPGTDNTLKPSDTTELVQTAKETKGKRKKGGGKVITNADVKKSKGKLLVITSNEKDLPPADPEKKPLTLAEQDELRRGRNAAEERVNAAEKRVGELARELERLEQRYYEENDPNHRDTVIRAKFNEKKQELDEAQRLLDTAVADLERLQPPS